MFRKDFVHTHSDLMKGQITVVLFLFSNKTCICQKIQVLNDQNQLQLYTNQSVLGCAILMNKLVKKCQSKNEIKAFD